MPLRSTSFVVVLLAVLSACSPAPLRIDSLSPSQGPLDQEVEISVRGQGFSVDSRVSLRGSVFQYDARTLSADGTETLVALLPAGLEAAVYDLHVENPDGGEARLAAAYKALASQLTMVVLDVGQGSAMLLIGTDGSTVLVDGGKQGRAETVLWAALERYSGGRLDAAVVSHFDIDHMAGVEEILRGPDTLLGTDDDPTLPLGLWDNGRAAQCSTDICQAYRNSAAGRGRSMSLGQEIQLGEARARCVAVNGALEGGYNATPDDNNAASIGLLVDFAGTTLLVSGDLPGGGLGHQDFETPLAEALGPVDLWVLNHHGSASSTSAQALALHRPRALFMSVGENNAYCHPAAELVERLDTAAIPVFLTGAGTTQVSSNCPNPTQLGDNMQVVGDIVIEVNALGQLQVQGAGL